MSVRPSAPSIEGRFISTRAADPATRARAVRGHRASTGLRRRLRRRPRRLPRHARGLHPVRLVVLRVGCRGTCTRCVVAAGRTTGCWSARSTLGDIDLSLELRAPRLDRLRPARVGHGRERRDEAADARPRPSTTASGASRFRPTCSTTRSRAAIAKLGATFEGVVTVRTCDGPTARGAIRPCSRFSATNGRGQGRPAGAARAAGRRARRAARRGRIDPSGGTFYDAALRVVSWWTNDSWKLSTLQLPMPPAGAATATFEAKTTASTSTPGRR